MSDYREFTCVVCYAESRHERFGGWSLEDDVCQDCVRRLAQWYVTAASGEPDTTFMTFGEAEAHLASQERKNEAERSSISRRVRTQVFERDAYRCVVCGSYKSLEIDHIHPVSRGGGNAVRNLQTLCGKCNAQKGARTMEEWKGRQ